MTPSPRAPLMAKHLSIECLTIGPTKMSREEVTPPHMEIFTRQQFRICRPSRASEDQRTMDPEKDQVHLSQDTRVRSMVQVPTEAKAFADSEPRVSVLWDKIKGDYAKDFFFG